MSQLNKINKLLRLYENNPNEAEATAALKKAAELMRHHLDAPESPVVIEAKLKEELRHKEEQASKICGSCGDEKPSHHTNCRAYKLERQAGLSAKVGCFSCSGILFLWFISGLLALLQRLFG